MFPLPDQKPPGTRSDQRMNVLEMWDMAQVGQAGLVLQRWTAKVRAAGEAEVFFEKTLRNPGQIPASTTPVISGISFYSLLSLPWAGRDWRSFKVPHNPTRSGTL